MVPGRFAWHDVGDFATIARLGSSGRRKQLVTIGDADQVLSEESSGLVIRGSDRAIALLGLRDVIVVDTPDALMVTTTEHAQRVKQVVKSIKESGRHDVV